MIRKTLGALLLATCGHAAAIDHAAAVRLVVDLQKLDTGTTMMLYDESDMTARDSIGRQLDALAPALDAAITDLTGDAAQTARENRATLVRALRGGDGSAGMLSSGYDAQAFAEYRTALGELLNALNARHELDKPASQEEQALLLAARIVAVYIRTAGSPFGSYSDTNDASTDEDLASMAARMDTLVAALEKKYAGNVDQAAIIRRVATKWRFIRSTVVKYTQQATPTIVHRHGLDIVDQLTRLL